MKTRGAKSIFNNFLKHAAENFGVPNPSDIPVPKPPINPALEKTQTHQKHLDSEKNKR